uniref:Uncharacterized protein n=1 Tax=Romanomermis culicivorax TaxID=13658 RepID=A0A915K5Y6_ROMCU
MENQMQTNFNCSYRNCNCSFDDAMIFDLHLRYCRIKNAHELTICHSNPMHVVPKVELTYHVEMCCNSRREVDSFIHQIHQSAMQPVQDLRLRHLIDHQQKIRQIEDADQIVPSIDDVIKKFDRFDV